MTKRICAVYGNMLIKETIIKWFIHFNIENIKNQEHSSPFAINNQIMTATNKNSLYNISKIFVKTFRTNQYLSGKLSQHLSLIIISILLNLKIICKYWHNLLVILYVYSNNIF